MKSIVLIALLTIFGIFTVSGQIKIGDNPQNIDPASLLELESSSRVLVISRVSTLQMEAIAPQRGGVVYNTDTECLHYFDGTQWVNLCDAVSFNLTNDPIENSNTTISIVDNGSSINLEVAPNSIRSENIVDGGINGDDIQDNSIGESKLGDDSVSSNELRDNSVGSSEIRDGSVQTTDMANTIPNQVMTSDENGIVLWRDASGLQGATGDEITITGAGTIADPLTLTDAIQNNINDNTVTLATHILEDSDTDDQNETLTDARLEGNNLILTESGTETTLDLGPLNNSGTDNQTLNLAGNILEIERGNTVNLNGFLDNTDEQQLSINPAGTQISLTNGGTISLPAGTVNTDNQNLSLTGNTINISGGTGVDLTPILGGGATDGVVTNVVLAGNDLNFTGVNGGFNGSVSLAGLGGGGAADGVITNMELTGTDLIVTGTAPGFSGTIPLGTLSGGTGSTEEADQTTITGIGTNADPFKIEPGAPGEFLTTDADGNVIWDDISAAGNITAAEVSVAATPANYTAATADVEAHLAGIDAALLNTATPNLTDVLATGASAGNSQINDLLNPTLPQDAATRAYVDGRITDINAAGGADGVITNVFLTGTEINFTGSIGGFDGAIDLDPNFVTETELTDAVTASEALDLDIDPNNEIELPDDATATAGQILATNADGTYAWIDDQTGAATIVSADADQILTVGTDTGALLTNVAIDATFATDAELVAAILVSDTADGDTSDTNEIQTITSTDNSVTVTPNGDDFDLSVVGGSDDQNLESAILTGSDLAINIEGGNNVTADLGELTTDVELAAAILASETADGDTSDINELQTITSPDASVTVTPVGNNYELTVAGGGTDDQNLESAILTGSDLAINIEGGNNVTADLGELTTDVELAAAILASETADGDTSDTNELQTITSPDASVTVTPVGNNYELTVTGGGTDDQNLESAILTGSDLAINIEGGNNVTADLGELTTDVELAAAILASETADGDTSDINELQTITSPDASVTVTPVGNNYELTVAGGGTDDQNLESAILTGSDLAINIEGGNNVTADLGELTTDVELAAAILASETADGDTSDTNEIELPTGGSNGQILSTDGAGNYSWIASSGITGTTGSIFFADNVTGAPTENNAQLFWDNTNGRLGIGNVNPQNKLHVSGEIRSQGFSNSNGTPNEPAYSFNNDTDTGMFRGVAGGGNAPVNWLRFATGGTEAITINPSQNVGIGPNFATTTIVARLHVDGNIRAEGTIEASGTITETVPDYVFQKYFLGKSELNEDYDFLSLKEIETFLKKNQHLPNVKSALEIKERGFWDLGEASRVNLEKIEELFLHTIEQEKKIEALAAEKEALAQKLERLEKDMDLIKQLLQTKSDKE